MTWFNSTAGKSLLEHEIRALQPFLEEKFGYYALQINFSEFDFLKTSRISKHLYSAGKSKNIDFALDALPFDTDGLDLVICPHLIEQINDHEHLFEELYRIIIPNGYCLLWSFNPFSFAGLRHFFGFDNTPPWNSRFLSAGACQQSLKNKGFVIEQARVFHYQPLFFDEKYRHYSFLESAGDRWFPLLGNVYCVMARKDVPGMTPIKPKWKKEKRARVVPNKT